jgi:transposase-like protein
MPYTAEQKQQAVNLYTQHGTAETARQTGISPTSIKRWAAQAGATVQTNTQKTVKARAAAAERITVHWSDYRSQEATAAGSAATRLRRQIVEASDAGNANLLRARTIAYGVLIDKAELLSGQATERIEVWAESEVDRELKEAISLMEDRIRGSNN